jgi:hypothetical protein
VNIAEDVGDALTVERDRVRRARLIEAKVEPAAIEERKDVMEERVAVG